MNTYRFLWGNKNPGKPFEAKDDAEAIDLILPTPPVRGKTYDQVASNVQVLRAGQWEYVRPK